MTEEKRYELIEAWLAGELSGKSLQQFEAQLQTDEELALEVEVVRDLSNLNTETPRNRLRNTLIDIRKTEQEERKPIPIFWWLRNAAAALVLLIGGYFMFNYFIKNDPPEFVQEPQPIITDEDEDGIIEYIDLENEPIESNPSEVVEKEAKPEKEKPPIIPLPKEEIVDKKDEQIQYRLTPEPPSPIRYIEPIVSSYIASSELTPVEYIPDYVSNPIPAITFFQPKHAPTFEEEEADRKTEEEMEKINQFAQENIKTDYEIVNGDTVEVLSSVASAVLYVADVPEKRLNNLLETEKTILETEKSLVKIDSFSFKRFYDTTSMGAVSYIGKLLTEKKSKIGFYIFNQDSYDFLNDDYLFFEELKIDENNQFSIEAQFELYSNFLPYYNLYAVFIDLETEELVGIERILVD